MIFSKFRKPNFMDRYTRIFQNTKIITSRKIPPQLRRQVWETYMKNNRSAYGPCFVCGCEIHITIFECGHVISHIHGGNISVENLRPVCGSCNKSMGTRNLNNYKAVYFGTCNKDQNYFGNLLKHMSINDKYSISRIDESRAPISEFSPKFEGCQHILLSGKYKGKYCNRNTVDSTIYCHLHKNTYEKESENK
jgi:hypothetical protein